LDRVQAACEAVEKRFGKKTSPAEVFDEASTEQALIGASGVLCAGAAGIQLIPESLWAEHPTLAVLADINAVPPLGVQGLDPKYDGEERHGKKLFGALGVGGLKMLVHRACVAKLFERNDTVLDAEAIFAVAKAFQS
jgi:hypothetical protein